MAAHQILEMLFARLLRSPPVEIVVDGQLLAEIGSGLSDVARARPMSLPLAVYGHEDGASGH
jgi:hypothetical protein